MGVKSRDELIAEIREEHPVWNDFDVNNYVNGYCDGVMEHMRLIDELKKRDFIVAQEKENNGTK